ncbi:MAG: phosphoribosylanthranilate isomerase [Halobacteria archaeon]
MVQVKICGNTAAEDARAAEAARADLIGLIIEPPVETPRKITLDRARDIARSLLKPVVAVLVDPTPEFALKAADATNAWAVQLSGNEPLDLVRKITDGVRTFKTVHVEPDGRIRLPPGMAEPGAYLRGLEDAADFLLLDSAAPGKAGGTGRTHNWSNARATKELVGIPLILAGGLTPDNVAQAVAEVDPWGVDVASGVEASPGRKDPARMKLFVSNAKGRKP